jgi:hypothetical protein
LAAICSCMHGPHLSQVHLPDQRMNLLQQDGHRWIGEGLIITILCAFWFYNLSITIFFCKDWLILCLSQHFAKYISWYWVLCLLEKRRSVFPFFLAANLLPQHRKGSQSAKYPEATA